MNTLRLVVVFPILTIFCFTVNAEPRWVIGVKSGAGAGHIGIEVEKEFGGGLALTAATGVVIGTPVAVGAAIAGRIYIGAEPLSRFFITAVGGIMSIEVPPLGGTLGATFIGLGGGYEWRLTKSLRLYGEVGLAAATFNLVFSVTLVYVLSSLSLGLAF